MLHEDVTNLILKAFYQVYRELGYGFIEGVYEAALEITGTELGLKIRRQARSMSAITAKLLDNMTVICWLMTWFWLS
jgi:GxxExxY protein